MYKCQRFCNAVREIVSGSSIDTQTFVRGIEYLAVNVRVDVTNQVEIGLGRGSVQYRVTICTRSWRHKYRRLVWHIVI